MISDHEKFKLHLGKSQEVLADYPDNYFDSVVTDPPYHLTSIVKRFGKQGSSPAQFGTDGAYARASRGFMGKEWDGGDIAFRPEFWAEVFRVLKPGGHLLAFSGSRTYHRMAVGIEDAGFEIRDQIMWLYGSGFPKSHDVSKAIDKAAGAEREVTGQYEGHVFAEWDTNYGNERDDEAKVRRDIPATDAARQWQGWGSALKPAHEPICMARKPLAGTIAENVLEWGTGAVNVDGCRVAFTGEADKEGWKFGAAGKENKSEESWKNTSKVIIQNDAAGRWPANLIHDGSPEIVTGFPSELGGSAARFFYCPKASKEDRDDGLYEITGAQANYGISKICGICGICGISQRHAYKPENIGKCGHEWKDPPKKNTHPTVKPTDLMRYLCRLVTPPGGVVLDPFMGSGSTGKGAMLEGFRFVGIDMTPEYLEIARARIQHAHDQRHDLPTLIRNEAKHSAQMSIFDAVPAAELPQTETEEA